MQVETVIIFCCFRNDATTRKHHRLFCELNPGIPVIPVSTEGVGLPGEIVMSTMCQRWDLSNLWRASDTFFYRLPAFGVTADRYIFVEWDVLSEVSIQEFLTVDEWNAELAVPLSFTQSEHPEWYWWRECDRLPEYLKPFAAGAGPLPLIVLSHTALMQLEAAYHPPDVFSEMRLGTLANYLQIPVTEISKQQTLLCSEAQLQRCDFPTIYHPIKTVNGLRPATEIFNVTTTEGRDVAMTALVRHLYSHAKFPDCGRKQLPQPLRELFESICPQ